MKISKLFSSIHNMDSSDEIPTTSYPLPNKDSITHDKTKFAFRKSTNVITRTKKKGQITTGNIQLR